MANVKRKPLKHLEVPESLGIGEGGKTLPNLYEYFQQVDDYIDNLKSKQNDIISRLEALEGGG